MTVDIHRHLMTPRLFEALACRTDVPRIRPDEDGWRLEVAHEAPSPVLPGEAPALEAGVDRGVVALSAALGVEGLPEDDARTIVEAWRADAAELPPEFDFWDAYAPDTDSTRLCLPATALGTPAALDRSAPLLERLERRGGVLFVHPGPATAGAWQPALTEYPAALMAAWLAWTAHGRRRHPRLKVLFAALAGLGPLHAERIAARGGPALAPDDRTFYDTSSYGPQAAAAVARVVGDAQLVYGSDHPWAAGDPASLPAAYSTVNAERLLEVAA